MKTRQLIVEMSQPEYAAARAWLTEKAVDPAKDGPGMLLLERWKRVGDGGTVGKPAEAPELKDAHRELLEAIGLSQAQFADKDGDGLDSEALLAAIDRYTDAVRGEAPAAPASAKGKGQTVTPPA